MPNFRLAMRVGPAIHERVGFTQFIFTSTSVQETGAFQGERIPESL
jgi:hypothetical protein